MTPSTQTPVAADFMCEDVQTVLPDWTLNEVVQFLLGRELSNAPVVEPSSPGFRLVGFISECDCLKALANETFSGTPSPHQTAASIMRSDPICVTPETELFSLASMFMDHGFRHLPVTQGDLLLGIVSRRDVLRAVDAFDGEYLEEGRHQQPES